MNAITKITMLADIRAEIEADGARFGTRPADTMNALDRLARITRRPLATIPATLPAVEAILKAVIWQNAGFSSKKRHDNWRALVRGAVAKSRSISGSKRPLFPREYPKEWKSWVTSVDQAVRSQLLPRFLRADVSAIPAWCAANGVLPTDFDSDMAKAFAEWCMKNRPSRGRRPNRVIKSAVYAWNRIAAVDIGGGKQVERPLGRARIRNIQLPAMPASLRADIEAYVHYARTRSTIGEVTTEGAPATRPATGGGRWAHLRAVQIRDVVMDNSTSAQKRGKPLGPVSEDTIRGALHFIRTLITAGAQRTEDLSDPDRPVLAPIPLVDGVRLNAFLDKSTMIDGFDLLTRRMEEDGKIDEETDQADLTSTFHSFAARVCAVAAWAKIDEQMLETMRAITRSQSVKTDSVGAMSPVRRAMLDEMDNPTQVLAWFRAPSALWRRAEEARKKGDMSWEVVRDAETAFIAWLISRLPIRRKNIGQLTIKTLGKEEAMIRLSRFEGEQSVIVIPGRFTKTGRPVRFKIRGEGEAMLRGILAKGGYRDAAMRLGGFADSEFLFVGGSHSYMKRRILVRGHRAFSSLGQGYTARLQEFGIRATLHVARHIAAQIALDFDPSASAVVANLLGSSVRTVEKHYLSDRTSKAAESFDEIVRGSITKALHMLSEGE